jgi:hypothetical protein
MPAVSEADEDGIGPLGSGQRVVEPGECLASIAEQEGFFWETLWAHADNAELAAGRESPYLLLPGDRVAVPAKRVKQVACATDRRHVFRRRGVPERLRICLEDQHGPRADVAYKLEIAGLELSGTTDADGYLEHWIPANARRGRLIIDAAEDQLFAPEPEIYELELGRLGPATSRAGARARLVNLELLESDDNSDAGFRTALIGLQRALGLPDTGELDSETIAALVDAHGS